MDIPNFMVIQHISHHSGYLVAIRLYGYISNPETDRGLPSHSEIMIYQAPFYRKQNPLQSHMSEK